MINIKNIIITDNIILIISVIFLLIADIFLLAIILINNFYVERNKKYFAYFFYGENNESVKIGLERKLMFMLFGTVKLRQANSCLIRNLVPIFKINSDRRKILLKTVHS